MCLYANTHAVVVDLVVSHCDECRRIVTITSLHNSVVSLSLDSLCVSVKNRLFCWTMRKKTFCLISIKHTSEWQRERNERKREKKMIEGEHMFDIGFLRVFFCSGWLFDLIAVIVTSSASKCCMPFARVYEHFDRVFFSVILFMPYTWPTHEASMNKIEREGSLLLAHKQTKKKSKNDKVSTNPWKRVIFSELSV